MHRQNLRLDWLQGRVLVGAQQRIVLAAIVLLSVIALPAMYILDEQNSSVRDEIVRIQQSMDQRRTVSHGSTGEEAAKRSKANQTIAQHNEVVAVLEVLEKIAPDGVLIESISLDPESKTYRIELRTAELEAARRYVDKLNNETTPPRMWHIASVQAQKQSGEWLAVLEMR